MRLVFAALALSTLTARASSQGLPPPPAPPENPVTAEKAVLGKILFWDEQLSSDNTMACGSCHQPDQGGTTPSSMRTPGSNGILGDADDVFGAPGVVASDANNNYVPHTFFGFDRQVGGRYPQTNLMGAYARETFWDGRGSSQFVDPQTGQVLIAVGGSLESQAVGPPLSDAEMAHEDRDWDEISAKLLSSQPLALASDWPVDVTAALAVDPTYPDLFARAFGSSQITVGRIAFALATYQRTLVPNQTPFDLMQLTQRQQQGFDLFNTRARCVICHGRLEFTDDRFHNIGLRPPPEDLGRQDVTGNPRDRGRFKTASLRNAGLRPRFMHNGEFATVRQVIDYYNMGGRNNDNQDPEIRPLGLNAPEINALIDFVRNGLTDPRVAARQAPFDRPTLMSERPGERPEVYGDDSPGTGGFRPRMLALSPANLGNIDFKLGLYDARGGGLSLLAIGGSSANIDANGVPINVDLTGPGVLLFLRPVSGGPGAGEGYLTRKFRIPNNPVLQGIDFYTQWFVDDPQAAGGIAATRGARLPLF